MTFRRLAITACAVLVAACTAPKPPSSFEKAYDDEEVPWTEVETQLPPRPHADKLVDIAVSGASSYRFAIDTDSLSIGSDGVFRYTLVATSASGARNVSYEGIRCQTHERKIYAIGRADGTWTKARNAAWARIEEVGNNRQHAALEKEYFCPDGYDARTVPQIVARLRPQTAPSEVLFDRNTVGVQH